MGNDLVITSVYSHWFILKGRYHCFPLFYIFYLILTFTDILSKHWLINIKAYSLKEHTTNLLKTMKEMPKIN